MVHDSERGAHLIQNLPFKNVIISPFRFERNHELVRIPVAPFHCQKQRVHLSSGELYVGLEMFQLQDVCL